VHVIPDVSTDRTAFFFIPNNQDTKDLGNAANCSEHLEIFSNTAVRTSANCSEHLEIFSNTAVRTSNLADKPITVVTLATLPRNVIRGIFCRFFSTHLPHCLDDGLSLQRLSENK
jgi:hypothetical protein